MALEKLAEKYNLKRPEVKTVEGKIDGYYVNITDDNVVKKYYITFNVSGITDKKEFEKGREPFKLPLSSESDKPIKIYESKGSSSGGDQKSDPSKSLLSNFVSNSLKYAKEEAANSIKPSGIDGTGVINRTAPVDKGSKQWKRIQSDYFVYDDPYDSSSKIQYFSTFGEAIEDLRGRGLLSSYKDIAGFEMGSDHLWKIKILPYPYDKDDVQMFSSLGRTSVVPPLPCYSLPDMWKESSKTDSSIAGKIKGFVGNITKESGPKLSINTPNMSVIGKGIGGMMNSLNSGGGDGGTIFSFSHNPPVLSYDITVGSMRADSMRLFNGSSSEVMAGMSYNALMSISILDDVYGSMKKYMSTFINAAYDINTNSMAPYYSIAFQLELIILRAGGQVNYHHKFIGVPTEYTVRHSGSQDTTEENRVDLTFGIIGYKTPTGASRQVYYNDMGGRAKDKTIGGNEKSFSLGKLKWRDITFKMGQGV